MGSAPLLNVKMLSIPREICCDLNQALPREWLVTNGLGGYASGSITGCNTRRYHGLLVTAGRPPHERTVTLAKIDEEVETEGTTYRLGTNEYVDETIQPAGYVFLERVELDGMIPSFFYRAATFSLTKTIWMEYGRNTTYIRYTLDKDSQPIRLTLLPLCTYRDFHSELRGTADWRFNIQTNANSVRVAAFDRAMPYHLMTTPTVNFVRLDLWYWRFLHRVERERGLDCVEDLYLPGLWHADLQPGESITVIATTEYLPSIQFDIAAARQRECARQNALIENVQDEFAQRLYLAADQFIVQRRVEEQSLNTIIAGYHWFGDWGRDTMIALEGLTLVTGRYADAKNILRAFARYVDKGMLPNRFPDAGIDAAPVEYNTVDATLWYFHAIDRYVSATKDETLLSDLFPILESIIDWHLKGTRYNIKVDPSDSLLYAGEPGVQLTWMDAKVGDWVVTPRIGKPVEINALWYRALKLMDQWSAQMGRASSRYATLATQVRNAFDRFWYADGKYLYDVIDAPQGNDPSLRPNQLFAVSLADDLVSPERAKSILDLVTQNLLTSFGLRSLSPHDQHYTPLFRGDQHARDAAYHQGIVWGWLIGVYIDAYLKVYGDGAAARAMLEPFQAHLSQAGLGSISEVFEGDPPFRPVGCIAQAWSVAEVLRALSRTI